MTRLRCDAKFLLAAVIAAMPSGVWAQQIHFHRADWFVRFSYDNPDPEQKAGLRHVCVAVSRDGDYQIGRSDESAQVRLHGKLSEEEFGNLNTVLSDSEFSSLFNAYLGFVSPPAETFEAEILRGHQTQRFQWRTAHGEHPFPNAVVKVIKWLKNLDPKNKVADAEDLGICPSFQ